ncbi:MAG: Fic family protein [Oscillospiraceae bacterium]|nr:Fic family protein [Oscillospiraceae bacterium]
MINKNPPFEITPEMESAVDEIKGLIGVLDNSQKLSTNPTLRRANRIKTIYGSLAIEQNTLTLEGVTAVLNGKRVLAPPADIEEVRNAYEIYERLDELNPYSIDDLVKAHGVMMRGLISECRMFRTKPVGVVDKDGNIVHFGTLPQYVPEAVSNLLDWAENSGIDPIILGCVVHYELELIHPFLDGNGRIGRLWHTLILSKYNPLFAWLPVESVVHDRQVEYYEAINQSNVEGESTEFIKFMLSAIKDALKEANP